MYVQIVLLIICTHHALQSGVFGVDMVPYTNNSGCSLDMRVNICYLYCKFVGIGSEVDVMASK